MSKETIVAKNFVEKLRMIDPEMQLQSVMALLLISEGHEKESWYTVKELAKKIGISSALFFNGSKFILKTFNL